MIRLRVWIVAGLMCLASAMAVVARPSIRMADQGPAIDLETVFPRQFGDWRIDERVPVVVPSPDVQAQLDKIYSQVLARTYVNSRGERVMLSVAYGGDQSDSMQVHRPEVCYPAQGFQVLSVQRDALSGVAGRDIPVQKVHTRLGSRNEPVMYWVVVGERVVGTNTEQKLAQLSYGLRGRIPDGMLVRVSSIHPDNQAAYAAQERFLREIAQSIAPQYQSRVFGSTDL
ncbi:EpsI family protein [Caldimonas thermodepolymerans]|jgi:EpsI family protein|uniref:EpsI family protein n=1 Tax=Caldimonas thermodepolymerans TaxID=215580 RepID=A0A2S5T913_9BURK|nr:exosortase-associated protein EpsI, B-type [Caldimonas thermodepolymerans]PPE71358.1 EpsI family protein [Caldimonas thermodepolymerans]QPC32532.1 EpsI family protein [Caldimonas thermodepolymerans]RDH98928.1 EpsI family protein [Caldimonas thermodepolymerans]TCP06326.1 EpsI family protein [Caldimonas thermodepolymerans]UZG49084.1 EpsI family protein [Caldimonas thermodepolymerans]